MVRIPLAIDNLEIKDPLKEEPMSEIYLSSGDRLLIDDPDRANKPAEVGVIPVRKDIEEDTGTQTIDVIE